MKYLQGLLAFAICVFPGAVHAQKGKPIVAIYQMDDLANSGQAATFSTMIESAITNTSKFRVMERERLGKLLGEQGRAKAGLVTSNKPGKVGGFEGADFLVYGAITSVSSSNKADIGSTMLAGLFNKSGNGPSCSNSVVTLAVDIKITDADTGEVKYVTRINETQKSAAACGGSGQINTAALLRSAADKVATGLVTAIYPIQIASVLGDGTIVLNYGEGSVLPGATMAVFAKGQAIIDPATGERIGNDETRLGLIQVTDVTGRISKALSVAGFASPPTVGAIVRIATATDLAAYKSKKKR